MSVSVARRTEGCLYLLRNEFDVEKTVDWFLREYAGDPAVQRASNKERLARNIVTIGGSGDQQELNLVAFQQALARFSEEKHRQAMARWEEEKKELTAQLRRTQEHAISVDQDYREKDSENQHLMKALMAAKEELADAKAQVPA